MTNILQQIKYLSKHKHCANCGEINPEFIPYGEDTQEGHTLCCNERLCEGEEDYLFGNEVVEIDACCWALAELKLKKQGVDILKQPGMRRIEKKGL